MTVDIETPPRGKHSRRITRSFASITILFVFILLVGYVVNNRRVDDIEENRISSCEQIFSGMQAVFLPLFSDPPRTERRIRHTKEFKEAIIRLKKECR